jgi:hypothetical protein
MPDARPGTMNIDQIAKMGQRFLRSRTTMSMRLIS